MQDHVREAWRRARLAGRTVIHVCDFPPSVTTVDATAWIQTDAATRLSVQCRFEAEKVAKLSSFELPFSVAGDLLLYAALVRLSRLDD